MTNTLRIGQDYQDRLIAHMRVTHSIDVRRSPYGAPGQVAGLPGFTVGVSNRKRLDMGALLASAEAEASDAGGIPLAIQSRQAHAIGEHFVILSVDSLAELIRRAAPELISPEPLGPEFVADNGERECPSCGSTFTGVNRNQKYCTKACKARDYRVRHGQQAA